MKVPDLKPVQSSNVQAIGYSDHGLFVRFQGGSLYQYPNVPRHVYEEGLAAESIGSWFRSTVRGKFVHKKHDA